MTPGGHPPGMGDRPMGTGDRLLGTGEHASHLVTCREPARNQVRRRRSSFVARASSGNGGTRRPAHRWTSTTVAGMATPTARVRRSKIRDAAALRLPTGHAASVGATRRTVGLLAVAALMAAVRRHRGHRRLRRWTRAAPARERCHRTGGAPSRTATAPPARQERPTRCRGRRPHRAGRQRQRRTQARHRANRGDPHVARRQNRCGEGEDCRGQHVAGRTCHRSRAAA